MKKDREKNELTSIPKRDVFRTPDKYFDALPDKILKKIEQTKDGKIRKLSPVVPWKAIGYAAAASMALIIVTLIAYQTPQQSEASQDLLAEVSTEDCIAYLQFSDLDIEEIFESSDPEVLGQLLIDSVNAESSGLDDKDLETLYEYYGVSADENLKPLN